jgi:hydroxypyruvate reductase
MTQGKELLLEMFREGLAAASPLVCVPPALPKPPKGRTVVVGAGKAGGSMALAFERNWPGPFEGLVVTRYGCKCDTKRLEVVEAAHPVPDEAGRQAARRIKEAVTGLGPDDLVVCLMSGGASALLTWPAEGISFEEKRDINRQLLMCGANIHEMNCVRKHLSAIKGGRLAAAAFPARVVTLAISDVVGNDPATIGSGPTVGDPSTLEMAREIIARYGLKCPPSVTAHLASASSETPKPGDAVFARAEYHLVASPVLTLDAAARVAEGNGYRVVNLGDAIEGDADEVGREQAAMALAALAKGERVCILSGGETTVVVRGKGKGGRNSEYLLAFTKAVGGAKGIDAIACDTDGVDGSEENAGALTSPDTLRLAAANGLDIDAYLANNDAYSYFQAVDSLVETGPTMTNVNDFRAILVSP